MHRVYFSTSKVGESGGPKHAPHEIFSEIDLAKFSPCLAYPTTSSKVVSPDRVSNSSKLL